MTTHVPEDVPTLIARREARSLALHVAAVAKIAAEPGLLNKARAVLEGWAARENPVSARTRAWQELLGRPWPEVASLIGEPSQVQLRKGSPIGVLLSEEERAAIFDRFAAQSKVD